MTEARELDTNLDTLAGHNLDAPWVGEVKKISRQISKIQKMEEEDFPCHQPSEDEFQVSPREAQQDEEDAHEFVRTEAEKDAADRLQQLKAPRAAKAAKRPRSPSPSEDLVPDLAEIFDNYDTPHPVRISICRAYASYIASLQPKKPRAAPKKKN